MKKILCAFLFVAILAGCAAAYDLANPPVVKISGGQLMGFMNGNTFTFLGIPYAQAKRFEPPQKVPAWEGVKSAQAYGAICPILNQTEVGADEFVWPHRYWVQNENCMNLNIWTQSITEGDKKPVIVFFHGGGYRNGSSIESAAYDGKNLSEYGNVVVVTVNHRLNILGFLDLSRFGEKYKDTANIGMQDLVASLKWIQENIKYFGGDPANVTIFGQSGGGGKVNNLMRMPSAEGTFHKAAALSSSYGLITKELNDKIVKGTLEKLGLKDVSELETYDYYNLINAAQAVCTELGTNWTPEADGVIIQEKFCSWADEIPFIGSTVFSEFNYSWRFAGANKNSWTDDEALKNLKDKYGDKAEGIAEEFRKVFPGRKLADAYFYYGAAPVSSTIYYICRRGLEENVLTEKTATAKAPVYEYLFDYEIPVNGGILPFHCCDLIYIFHNVDIPVVTIATGGDETAHKMQDTVADSFLAFMRTGNPSTEKLEWKPYTPSEKNIMIFSPESKCRVLGDEKLYTLMDEAINKK